MHPKDERWRTAVLFSIAGLPLAACPADEDDDDTTGNDPTGADDTGADDTGADDTGADDTGADDTGSASEAGSESSEGGDLPPVCYELDVPPLCTMYADKYTECMPDAPYHDEIASYCACATVYYADLYGAACSTAFEDYFACLTALDCETLNADEEGCPAEWMAVETACSF